MLQYLVLSPVQLHPLKEGSYVPATTLPHQKPELGTELLEDKGCKDDKDETRPHSCPEKG